MKQNKSRHLFFVFLIIVLVLPGSAMGLNVSTIGDITVKPPTQFAPAAPSNLTASSFPGSLSIGLNWQDNSNNETGFTIERKDEDGAFVKLATTASGVVLFFDETAVSDTRYTYRVYATGSLTNSAYSNEAAWETVPNRPTAFEAKMDEQYQRINLHWHDNSQHETDYLITKATQSTATTSASVQQITLPANTLYYHDKDVQPGVRYKYIVSAKGQGGISLLSNEVWIRFLAAPSKLVVVYFPGSSEMALKWQDNCNEEAGFVLQRAFNADTHATSLDLPQNTTEYNDEFRPDTKYWYRIKSKSAQTDTVDSNYSDLYIWYSPPRMPENFKAEALSSSEVKLVWDDKSTYETRFIIGRNDGAMATEFKVAPNTTSYVDKGLKAGTEYRYFIRAVNENSNTQSDYLQSEVRTKSLVIKPGQDILNKVQAVLEIGSPNMSVNGQVKEIDPGKGTSPVIVEGRTLVPVKAIVDAIGGTLSWNDSDKKVTIGYNGKTIDLWIGQKSTRVNGVDGTTDVAPQILNDRTMLPIGFISLNLGLDVTWNPETRQVIIKAGS